MQVKKNKTLLNIWVDDLEFPNEILVEVDL